MLNNYQDHHGKNNYKQAMHECYVGISIKINYSSADLPTLRNF